MFTLEYSCASLLYLVCRSVTLAMLLQELLLNAVKTVLASPASRRMPQRDFGPIQTFTKLTEVSQPDLTQAAFTN